MADNVIPLFGKPKVEERREDGRIKYPVLERAMVKLGSETRCKIHNISQSGMKFIGQMSSIPSIDSRISGTLNFPNQDEVFFEGQVIRIIGDLVTVRFLNPIDQEIIQKELQRFALLKVP